MASSQSLLEELVLSLFTRVSLTIIQGSSHAIPVHSHDDPTALNFRPVSRGKHDQRSDSSESSITSVSSAIKNLLKGRAAPSGFPACSASSHIPHSHTTHPITNAHETCDLVLDILVSGSSSADVELDDCVLVERWVTAGVMPYKGIIPHARRYLKVDLVDLSLHYIAQMYASLYVCL